MKKFLVCLMCCFGVFTLCSATSTVEDVYLNRYAILVNGQTYFARLPILNYQGRTYLPLNEFGSITGNNVSFSNNTISVSQNVSTQKHKELFMISSMFHNVSKSLTTTSMFYHNCYNEYYLSYLGENLGKGFKSSQEALNLAAESINSFSNSKDLITDICIENTLATSAELNKLFKDLEYYPLFLQQCTKNMNLEMTANLKPTDYSDVVALCDSGLVDINNSINKIQSKISSIILEQN